MPVDSTKFDALNYLKTQNEQTAYIEAALEEDDPFLLAAALGDIVKARGVTAFARETGLSRETIYKSFRPGGNPTIATVLKAVNALGLKLKLVAA